MSLVPTKDDIIKANELYAEWQEREIQTLQSKLARTEEALKVSREALAFEVNWHGSKACEQAEENIKRILKEGE